LSKDKFGAFYEIEIDIMQPIVEAFSLLAIGTSYIGFILGLADFLADCKYFSLTTIGLWRRVT